MMRAQLNSVVITHSDRIRKRLAATSLRTRVITFYDMAGVAGSVEQMNTLLCVSLRCDPVLRGEIPLEKEFIDPETCSMQKALKMVWAAKAVASKEAQDFYHLSCLCGMRNLRTRHI